MADINVSVHSKALANAIAHHKGDLDGMIHDLMITWQGQYENADHAQNWNGRQAIFARNAHRKTTRAAMEEWMMQNGTFGDDNQEEEQPMG